MDIAIRHVFGINAAAANFTCEFEAFRTRTGASTRRAAPLVCLHLVRLVCQTREVPSRPWYINAGDRYL